VKARTYERPRVSVPRRDIQAKGLRVCGSIWLNDVSKDSVGHIPANHAKSITVPHIPQGAVDIQEMIIRWNSP